MNNPAIEALAGQLFKLLLESELSEAEVVKALAIGTTMRLAYDTSSTAELLMKVDALAALFKQHARVNIEAFSNAQQAKDTSNA